MLASPQRHAHGRPLARVRRRQMYNDFGAEEFTTAERRAAALRHRADRHASRGAACCSTCRATRASTGSNPARSSTPRSSRPAPTRRASSCAPATSCSCAPAGSTCSPPATEGYAQPGLGVDAIVVRRRPRHRRGRCRQRRGRVHPVRRQRVPRRPHRAARETRRDAPRAPCCLAELAADGCNEFLLSAWARSRSPARPGARSTRSRSGDEPLQPAMFAASPGRPRSRTRRRASRARPRGS